tara:strand:- start:421 stop:645 length:225 start_codon:yes stop_codon:yes gene_type:complete
MAVGIEAVIWYLVLLDSLGANIAAWFFPKRSKKLLGKFGKFAKHFPITKGWCAWYLVLILWVGSGLYRLGLLGF